MLVHKGGQIKNWGEECRDVTSTNLQCQNIQRALQVFSTKNNNNNYKEINKNILNNSKKKIFFFRFSPIDLRIILYQLTKFESHTFNSF